MINFTAMLLFTRFFIFQNYPRIRLFFLFYFINLEFPFIWLINLMQQYYSETIVTFIFHLKVNIWLACISFIPLLYICFTSILLLLPSARIHTRLLINYSHTNTNAGRLIIAWISFFTKTVSPGNQRIQFKQQNINRRYSLPLTNDFLLLSGSALIVKTSFDSYFSLIYRLLVRLAGTLHFRYAVTRPCTFLLNLTCK